MSDTGWRVRGTPRLIFGRMFEDSAIERNAFPPGCRVFSIASGGCTPIALANAGYRVTAVDFNAAQIAYVVARVSGEPPRLGVIDGALERALRFAPGERERQQFCNMTECAAQTLFWQQKVAKRPLRWGLRVLTSAPLLRLVYSPPVIASLPPRFDRVLLKRLEIGFGRFPNASNPFVRAYLLGERSPVRYRSGEIRLFHSGAAEYLESVPPESFDVFTLSNIFDGAGEAYSTRLSDAVKRAASPGAILVVRRFRETDVQSAAQQDRAMLWGSVEVSRISG